MNKKKRFEVHIGMKEHANINCMRELIRSLHIILENHPDISYIGLVEVPVEENEGMINEK